MTRSPLAYPLNRGVDSDAGGAADLQTDIMRFMAILALCLVAIFALVQSIPLAPRVTAPQPATEPEPVVNEPAPEHIVSPPRTLEPVTRPEPALPEPARILLTRPKWQPRTRVEPDPVAAPVSPPVADTSSQPEPAAVPEPPPAARDAAPREQGFTLRFESDLALTRLVASGQVGFYAITTGRTQRMTVSESRISFWDASTPNSFHEMEADTVPAPVIAALERTGVESNAVDWGVTLPGRLRRDLDTVMSEHTGGSLVIAANGELRLETP